MVPSASGSLELDLQYTVEVLHTMECDDNVSGAIPESPGASLALPLVLRSSPMRISGGYKVLTSVVLSV